MIEGHYISITWRKSNIHIIQLKPFDQLLLESIDMAENGFHGYQVFFGGYQAVLYTNHDNFSDISLSELQDTVNKYLDIVHELPELLKTDENFDLS